MLHRMVGQAVCVEHHTGCHALSWSKCENLIPEQRPRRNHTCPAILKRTSVA
jgi:hypothetical protein